MYYLVRVNNSVSQGGNGNDIYVSIVMKSPNIAELKDAMHKEFLRCLEDGECIILNGTERIQAGSDWEDWEDEPEEWEDELNYCLEELTTWEWLHFRILSDEKIEKEKPFLPLYRYPFLPQ